MAKKSQTNLIKLRNPETGTFYLTTKNPKAKGAAGAPKEKLKLKKYDKKTRKHEIFVESKI